MSAFSFSVSLPLEETPLLGEMSRSDRGVGSIC